MNRKSTDSTTTTTAIKPIIITLGIDDGLASASSSGFASSAMELLLFLVVRSQDLHTSGCLSVKSGGFCG